MKTQSADTSPEAERVQIALLRRVSPEKRLDLALDLSAWTLKLSLAGLRRRHPEASVCDLLWMSAALRYGTTVAEQGRRHSKGDRDVSIPENIRPAVAPVIAALDELGIAYYIGGSLASSLHGIPRSTMDVDLVAMLQPGQVGALLDKLQDQYYVDEQTVREAIQHHSSFNLIHFDTSLKVDIFVLKPRDYDQEAFRRRAHGEGPEGALTWATPEDTVLAKLEWYRLGGETSERQWLDVLGVMKVQAEALDLAYLRHWAPELGVADLLARALVDAGLAKG
ncbi:MAG TPA: hypothetical protein VF116_18160 [Ktedonobacterales bacterium]